jgi:hypothetical protein
MRKLSIVLWAASCLGASLHAQNFISDGDFSGGVGPWTITGGASIVQSAPGSPGVAGVVFTGTTGTGGAVTQTFATIPGDAYRLNFDLGETNGVLTGSLYTFRPYVSILVTIQGANGGMLVTTVFNPQNPSSNIYETHTAMFIATSTQTTLAFTDTSNPAAGASPILENVSVAPVAAFSYPGTYHGSFRLVRTVAGTDATTTLSYSVVAHINSFGVITGFFSPVETTFTGTITDSGAVTYGDDESTVGSASVSKSGIKITIPGGFSFDANFRTYGYNTTRTFSLRRVGP